MESYILIYSFYGFCLSVLICIYNSIYIFSGQDCILKNPPLAAKLVRGWAVGWENALYGKKLRYFILLSSPSQGFVVSNNDKRNRCGGGLLNTSNFSA